MAVATPPPLPLPWSQVRDPELGGLLGEARFFSITYRLFKLASVETTCEDYGQALRYKVRNSHRGAASSSCCGLACCCFHGGEAIQGRPAVQGGGFLRHGKRRKERCAGRSAAAAARPRSASVCGPSGACPPLRMPHLQGTIPGHPHSYMLDDHHNFQSGKWYETCGSTGARGCWAPHGGLPAAPPPPLNIAV